MIYVLKQNFNYFLKILPGFLSLMFVVLFSAYFPELSIIIGLFKILFAFFTVWKWSKRIKEQSKLKFFKPSFLCMSLYWGIIIVNIILKNKIGGIMIFLFGTFWVAGVILSSKMLKDSGTAIRKYYPQIKLNTEVHSLDEYFEIFSRAENLGMELSALKKETPSAVEEAIMQREAGKLIPFFHLDVIFFTEIMLCGMP